MKLLFATHNVNKRKEVERMLPQRFALLCLADMPESQPVEETQDSLRGNAELKAVYAYNAFGMPAFSDDSGLFVPALGGKPGVHSARYAGRNAGDRAHIAKLLEEMKGIADRSAYFETCIAFTFQNQTLFFHGRVDGQITEQPLGNQGFGYDPVFRPILTDQTFAQMTAEGKNQISHRRKAFDAFSEYLEKFN